MAAPVRMLRNADHPRTNEFASTRGRHGRGRVKLSTATRRRSAECLAQMLRERLQHQASHGTETEETVVTYPQPAR